VSRVDNTVLALRLVNSELSLCARCKIRTRVWGCFQAALAVGTSLSVRALSTYRWTWGKFGEGFSFTG
jgi:hypothetical protein